MKHRHLTKTEFPVNLSFAKVLQVFHSDIISDQNATEFLDIWQLKYDPYLEINDEVSIMTQAEKLYAGNFKDDSVRGKWERRLAILKLLLAHYLDEPLDQIEIIVGNGIKPSIRRHNIEFNTTHSDNVIIVAISTKPVGIDFELTSSWSKNISRSSLHLTLQEIKTATSLRYCNRLLYERALWSLKEAVVKLSGQGLKRMSSALQLSNKISIPNNELINLLDRNGNTLVSRTNSLYSFALASSLRTSCNYHFNL